MKSNVTAAAELSAILTAIPDLMFIMQRDGTYVDYHARDAALLFAPPSSFIGRTVRDVMPPPLGDLMMNALEDASRSGDPVVLEYELPMGEPRYYEARIVRMEADRLLSIVRDITELKKAAELNRELARRLISSQEVERQRIARELHDDISQRVAALNIELDRAATEAGSEALRAYLRRLSAQASTSRFAARLALVLAALVFGVLALMRPQAAGTTETSLLRLRRHSRGRRDGLRAGQVWTRRVS